ncbi:hypothetical protein RMSM_04070 [Rhodopirellula maiorica SM1]|uniref:Uncharacterized protein n=1 Tax=Rhodopirellula maiorica SM1 TaxID=1265738 RepID=M5RII1_9BACT|nr:hypothetical protein RMSM_04070 [Rhodopirellula maiorica SM1]
MSVFYSSADQDGVVEPKIQDRFKNDARSADNAFFVDSPSKQSKMIWKRL